MRLVPRSALVCALAGAVATVLTAAAPPVEQPALETRALWVVRTSLDSPDSIRAMVRTAVGAGFNTVFVQIRGRGDAYYRSDVEPRAPTVGDGANGFDPLALTLDLARDAGLSVHGWVNVNLVASATSLPESSAHVIARHPEWLMVPRALARPLFDVAPTAPEYTSVLARWTRRASDRVEGLYLSPILPAAQDYSVAVVRELVERYPLDGLHFDYVRFPDAGFDYSRTALAEFRAAELATRTADERAELDRAAEEAPEAWATALPDSWAAFRRDRMTTLLSRLSATARGVQPDLTISAAVLPRLEEARDHRFQDWARWAARGYLDAVCPMIYTTDTATFETDLVAVRQAVPAADVWAGIGAYRLSAWRAANHIRLARLAGASGVALFSYDSLAAQRDGGAAYLAHIGPALIDSPPHDRRR